MIFMPSIRAWSGRGMEVAVAVGIAVDVGTGAGCCADVVFVAEALLNRAAGAVGVIPGVGDGIATVGIIT